MLGWGWLILDGLLAGSGWAVSWFRMSRLVFRCNFMAFVDLFLRGYPIDELQYPHPRFVGSLANFANFAHFSIFFIDFTSQPGLIFLPNEKLCSSRIYIPSKSYKIYNDWVQMIIQIEQNT